MSEQLLIHPYDLPLRRPWESAKGRFARRYGFMIEVRSESLRGFGDCAPLPEAGTETLEQAEQQLPELQERLRGTKPESLMEEIGSELDALPATRFALECALLDLISKRARVSLRRHLSAAARDRLPVNIAAGPLASVTAEAAREYYDQGFHVLKIKVGIEDPAIELERLAELFELIPPDLGLRLDANGAWSFDQAKSMVDALARLPIESLEEPLREPTSEQLAELQSGIPFPLARDESLRRRLDAETDMTSLGVRRLVLKPAVLGGLQRTLDVARAATDAGMEVVITSLIETAAGLWPTAQLAAATRSSIPHGLSTSDWLAQDLGSAPVLKDGFIQLPLCAGSGFTPTPDAKTSL
ncbi:o-succinylbenzoate synthase [Thiorhodococcus mannitoliphagus]|uniref:o-succinylbenzoate synthase n=1 Tax=Thiorhodococcus mannitoliphagus TaxID=329406 RepID=A0A6P1E089_9GAMM|nr:o-succinylbenzoate synthase [Thiorhodococcus mannitoliphagus]NEX22703.1 o-succinylbenzoate synthase [Thiorhodococcus mannitoliphagus]